MRMVRVMAVFMIPRRMRRRVWEHRIEALALESASAGVASVMAGPGHLQRGSARPPPMASGMTGETDTGLWLRHGPHPPLMTLHEEITRMRINLLIVVLVLSPPPPLVQVSVVSPRCWR